MDNCADLDFLDLS